jgi:hypothetical protein
MTDGLPGDAVFGELVNEGTREDEVKEGIEECPVAGAQRWARCGCTQDARVEILRFVQDDTFPPGSWKGARLQSP